MKARITFMKYDIGKTPITIKELKEVIKRIKKDKLKILSFNINTREEK